MPILDKRDFLVDVVLRPYGAKLLIALVLIIAATIIGMAPPFIIRELVDRAIPERDLSYISELAAALIIVAVCVNITSVLQTTILTKIGQSISSDLRVRLFNSFYAKSLQWFSETNTGSMQSKIITDVAALQSIFTSSSAALASYAALTVANVIVLGLMDIRLLLISIILVPLAAYVNIVIGKKENSS